MIRTKRCLSSLTILLLVLCLRAWGDAPQPGKNDVTIRGQRQEVWFFPGTGAGGHRKVLFAPGDGGWHGFAIDIAENLQAAGYDVYGVDTRCYLQSFTGSAVLKPAEIAGDFRQIADWARQGSQEKVLLVGWSEGAGLGLAATADEANRKVFGGLVVIGMTEQNILAWRYSDLFAEIAKKLPNEPTFASADYISKVSPTPFFIIASSHDEYVSLDATKRLLSMARDPKGFVTVEARDHKYGGNTDTFFRTLREALLWTTQQHK